MVASSPGAMSKDPQTATAAPLSSPNEGDKCPFHGIEANLFCKEECCEMKRL